MGQNEEFMAEKGVLNRESLFFYLAGQVIEIIAVRQKTEATEVRCNVLQSRNQVGNHGRGIVQLVKLVNHENRRKTRLAHALDENREIALKRLLVSITNESVVEHTFVLD